MRVFLTGGTGFIGSHIVGALVARGDQCVVVSRAGQDPWHHEQVRVIRGDPTSPGAWQQEVAGTDTVVNLAGAPILELPHRWTAARKHVLRSSRVDTTRNVVQAIRDADPRPATLVSTSAIGYYGGTGDAIIDESAPAGGGFLGELASEWEAVAREAEDFASVTIIRGGIALGQGSRAFDPLVLQFKLGLGGAWGDGKEWWSWIHIADHVALTLFVIDNAVHGPVNLTAPNPVTVNEFARALARALRRPALFRAPAFALRLALGEAADALLALQRVVPKRALEVGYQFRFPTLEGALVDLL